MNAKKIAADAALTYVKDDMILGVGTGSTINFFIDALTQWRGTLRGAVSSSEETTKRLKLAGIEILELNHTGGVELYIDGADETDKHGQLIKGGGGALTREKIIAAAAKRFICIADESKYVGVLGEFPLPLEVIPMARSYVAREVLKFGGQPVLRGDFVTDNGNQILDIYGLRIIDPPILETQLNGIAGVVTVGLFAHRGADLVLLGGPNGVRQLDCKKAHIAVGL